MLQSNIQSGLVPLRSSSSAGIKSCKLKNVTIIPLLAFLALLLCTVSIIQYFEDDINSGRRLQEASTVDDVQEEVVAAAQESPARERAVRSEFFMTWIFLTRNTHTLFWPLSHFVLTDSLWIAKSLVVLRGMIRCRDNFVCCWLVQCFCTSTVNSNPDENVWS